MKLYRLWNAITGSAARITIWGVGKVGEGVELDKPPLF